MQVGFKKYWQKKIHFKRSSLRSYAIFITSLWAHSCGPRGQLDAYEDCVGDPWFT